MDFAQSILDSVNDVLSNYVLVALLLLAAIVFTVASRGVQFRMVGEMFRVLVRSGEVQAHAHADGKHISSFQAFMVSIASRVGTGNLAGVATAIALGGPGAVFWMWTIAILGAATAFVESTLAQLFKIRGKHSFLGGPAYYIQLGIGRRWWAVTFAILITVTFGLAFNSVQSNTISQAFEKSFGLDPLITGIVLALLSVAIISGGIRRIAHFSQWAVPFMAIAYIIFAAVIIALNISRIPEIFALIFKDAFGFGQVAAGGVGIAISMGIKRGLFSNEAGEGSTPNAAATATVSHPVKQGLVQALGVYTDTLLICSCTAFIILCGGAYCSGVDGIALTQVSIDQQIPGQIGSIFVSVAIFFFAFTSIVANYYYGEANIAFIGHSRAANCSGEANKAFIGRGRAVLFLYRAAVGAMVLLGALSSLGFVWALADVTMALMTLCNLAALALLGKYAIRCLKDYSAQRRAGKDPVYRASTIPEIASRTQSWPK
ncbi:MAG: alanine:cation symporter family protein [Lachnospiraceae bacterium]|nr:alanine:cation symporter family protein [Lachnospiraceae bacterium]